MPETKSLSINDHSRCSAGLRYVYPVLSRRAGGLSIGINLNPNNACNWRCIYCQVPDLKRGSAPQIDLILLRTELEKFLEDVKKADFYQRFGVDPKDRLIRDIAVSGNGEPTSVRNFETVIDLIGDTIQRFKSGRGMSYVLITNGSLVHQASVRSGLRRLSQYQGEVWFKLDRGSDAGLAQINNAGLSAEKVAENLLKSAEYCPTWVQTSVFKLDGEPISCDEQRAYIGLLKSVVNSGVSLNGVMLYGLARPSLQPEADRLSAVSAQWVKQFAAQIEALGLMVKINV